MVHDENESRTLEEYLNLSDPDTRDNALLTKSLRRFLCNQGGFDDSSRSTYRHRIRNRVRNGLRDFEYMRALSPEDIRMVYSKMDDSNEKFEVTTDVLGFLYSATQRDGDIDFEAALERAISFHEHRMEFNEGYRVTDVDVQINIHRTEIEIPDYQEAKQKLDDGEPLTSEEVQLLLRELPNGEVERLRKHVRRNNA